MTTMIQKPSGLIFTAAIAWTDTEKSLPLDDVARSIQEVTQKYIFPLRYAKISRADFDLLKNNESMIWHAIGCEIRTNRKDKTPLNDAQARNTFIVNVLCTLTIDDECPTGEVHLCYSNGETWKTAAIIYVR